MEGSSGSSPRKTKRGPQIMTAANLVPRSEAKESEPSSGDDNEYLGRRMWTRSSLQSTQAETETEGLAEPFAKKAKTSSTTAASEPSTSAAKEIEFANYAVVEKVGRMIEDELAKRDQIIADLQRACREKDGELILRGNEVSVLRSAEEEDRRRWELAEKDFRKHFDRKP